MFYNILFCNTIQEYNFTVLHRLLDGIGFVVDGSGMGGGVSLSLNLFILIKMIRYIHTGIRGNELN